KSGAKRRRKPTSKVIDVGEGGPPDATEPAAARAPGRKRAEAAERGRGDGAHEADGAHDAEAADTEAETEAETEPEIDEAPDGADRDMAAAAAIEPDEVLDDDAEAVPAEARGSSLAKRDPMAVYLRETRRYPLLTPDEERELATRLVEHGDSQA